MRGSCEDGRRRQAAGGAALRAAAEPRHRLAVAAAPAPIEEGEPGRGAAGARRRAWPTGWMSGTALV